MGQRENEGKWARLGFQRVGADDTAKYRVAGERGGAEPIRTGEHGLLTPWLRCGSCGGRIRVNPGGQPNKRTYLYNCASRIESTNSCPGISIRVEKLDRLVLDAIESQILTPDNLQPDA